MGFEQPEAEAAAAPSSAPSDAPAAPGAELKKPADGAARAREADRARRRRLLDKLKDAKSEQELIGLMKKLGGAVDAGELPAKIAAPLEPGQLPGWPPPSEIAQWRATLAETLATIPQYVAPFLAGELETDEQRKIAAAVFDTFSTFADGKPVAGPAAERLAEAWAPIAARYAPALLTSPWAGAIGGTLATGVIIGGAVKKAADEIAEAKKGTPA